MGKGTQRDQRIVIAALRKCQDSRRPFVPWLEDSDFFAGEILPGLPRIDVAPVPGWVLLNAYSIPNEPEDLLRFLSSLRKVHKGKTVGLARNGDTVKFYLKETPNGQA